MKSSTGRRKCTRCGLNRAESSFTSARGRLCKPCRTAARRKTGHGTRILSTYGITEAEYDAILEEQGGGCAGCGRPPRGKRRFDVDHDHSLQSAGLPVRLTVRGILCPACNRKVLPYARNNPETLRRLAHYLEMPPARRVL